MKEPRSSMTGSRELAVLGKALDRLAEGFAGLPPTDGPAVDHAALEAVLLEAAQRLHDNFPYFHPMYAGQMLKPPHPAAWLAYALAMAVNPNNHALDGGRASSAMEKEAVAALARMIGWDTHLGHLTGGGTMANLEALWVAGRLAPGRRVLASTQAHYTHSRLSEVLGLPFTAVPADRRGRLDLDALDRELARGDVGTVVATIGTTAAGAVDPLPGILDRRSRHGFRVHADAAYGGYFRLLAAAPAAGAGAPAGHLGRDARSAFQRLGEVDSLVVDPHKHGLQPYGCGCILFRDPSVGRFYRHDSPYTYFSSSELHLGEISLECSRPGAAAVALWATQRLLPLNPGGTFARGLARGREAALGLYERLRADRAFLTAFPPELDIVVWAVRAPSVTAASARARAVFEEAGRRGLHLALAGLPVSFFDLDGAGMTVDAPAITCLRSVLMKPDHLDWLDRLWAVLQTSV